MTPKLLTVTWMILIRGMMKTQTRVELAKAILYFALMIRWEFKL